MRAIYKRELKSFFTSPIGYVFIAINLFLTGIYFVAYNLQGTYPYFSYTISSALIVFFITVPIITMRIFSEERKNKTDQLILTSPVSVGKIVLGKYLAVATVLGAVMLVICCYPLILKLYGETPTSENYLAILGFALYGLAGTAVGLFFSSITESQIIAAVLSFAFMFATYFMQGICGLISATGNLLTNILGAFDFTFRLNSFLSGSLEVPAIIYFLTVIALSLFLTTQSILKRRYNVSVKDLKMGVYSSISVVAAIAAAAIINIVVAKIPARFMVFDVTADKLYTLSSETKELLKSLDEEVTVYVYCKEENYDTTTAKLLDQYTGHTDRIKVEYINPALYPSFCQKYTTANVSVGSLIAVCGEKSRVIDYDELYETETSFDYTTYSYSSTTTGYDAEGQLTSAISYITGDETPTIYYTSGHGELEVESSISDAISKSNMDLKAVTLLTEGNVPEDAQMLLINNPGGDFSKEDIEILREYMNKGGNIVVNLCATGDEFPVLWGFLSEFGLEISNTLVMEADPDYYYTYPLYLLPHVEDDPVTSGLYGSYFVFAPYSLGMLEKEEKPENVVVTPLLYTTEDSYAKAVSGDTVSYLKEDGDLQGQFVVAAKVEVTNEDGSEAKLLVNACSNMFSDSADQMVAGANTKFFTGVLTDFSNLELTVSIPVKSYTDSYLTVTAGSVGYWRFLCLFFVPVVLITWGIVVWVRRRKR